jgi:hypothetical protein
MAKKNKKQTIGATLYQQAEKSTGALDSVKALDLANYVASRVFEDIKKAVEQGEKDFPGQDFFVVCVSKSHKVLSPFGVPPIDCKTVHRRTCPTPNYDQSVYKFHHESGNLEFIWSLPDRDTCIMFLENSRIIAPDEQVLLSNIIKFSSGELLLLCNDLNGEKRGSMIGELNKSEEMHVI